MVGAEMEANDCAVVAVRILSKPPSERVREASVLGA